MTTTGTAVTGPRSPREVWQRYADHRLWSTWSPQIREVELDADHLAAGVSGRVYGWAGTGVAFEVDTWDEGRRTWSWTVRPHLVTPALRLPEMHLEHVVEACAQGTRARLAVTGPAAVVYGYVLPARLALHRLVH